MGQRLRREDGKPYQSGDLFAEYSGMDAHLDTPNETPDLIYMISNQHLNGRSHFTMFILYDRIGEFNDDDFFSYLELPKEYQDIAIRYIRIKKQDPTMELNINGYLASELNKKYQDDDAWHFAFSNFVSSVNQREDYWERTDYVANIDMLSAITSKMVEHDCLTKEYQETLLHLFYSIQDAPFEFMPSSPSFI